MKTVWFGILGYPEIKRVKVMVTADTREGRFLRDAMCARVQVEEFRGIVCLQPDDPEVMNPRAVIAQAKKCVDYQRKKRGISPSGSES